MRQWGTYDDVVPNDCYQLAEERGTDVFSIETDRTKGDLVTAVSKLYVLLCSYEILPRSVCLRGGGDRFVESVPVSAYLLETQQGFVLFDTGINADLVRDPALRHQHFTMHGW